MTQNPIFISLPITDRRISFRFYGDGLGFEPIGQPAEDGIPSRCSSRSPKAPA